MFGFHLGRTSASAGFLNFFDQDSYFMYTNASQRQILDDDHD